MSAVPQARPPPRDTPGPYRDGAGPYRHCTAHYRHCTGQYRHTIPPPPSPPAQSQTPPDTVPDPTRDSPGPHRDGRGNPALHYTDIWYLLDIDNDRYGNLIDIENMQFDLYK